jgi:hypothetical protein
MWEPFFTAFDTHKVFPFISFHEQDYSGTDPLDVLVNDIWGGGLAVEWHEPVWERSLEKGLRLLKLGADTRLIKSHFALSLLIGNRGGLLVEVIDGTAAYNQTHYRLLAYYDLAKTSVISLA